jgi:hypothetical protein
VLQFAQALADRGGVIADAGNKSEAGNKNSGHAKLERKMKFRNPVARGAKNER